jgi:hypothetical protein
MRIVASTADAEIYLSQPGLGTILGARVLAEFGDDADRYVDAKARKNYDEHTAWGHHHKKDQQTAA